MKSLLVINSLFNMKKFILTCLFLFFSLASTAIVQKTSVERLVNDFAGVLSERQVAALEDSLVRYALRTSTQVTVVTVRDLEGYDVSSYAYEIGEKWGVGQSGKNNGVVILVKPKFSANDRGRAFIAPGYGLEGALPDVVCTHIVNDEMIPYFLQNNYANGIIAGAIAVMKACEGEYYASSNDEDDFFRTTISVLLIIAIFIVLSRMVKGDNHKGGGHVTFGGLGGPFVWGSSSDWGSFSGGRGSFGGFGGGHFGGGGGGGSW
ncbi:MAG: TPM domain-containing protein [Bacteroidales bacterium]|nr:TPM domain-containing protein [Bacteroidales bacterium]